MNRLKIFIITGLSGSGKSTALNAFEDAGFFCVDNLPVVLLPKILELPIESETDIAGLAFGMDIRERRFLPNYAATLGSLKSKGYKFNILFLEADENVLLQRYSLTRRQHPLARDKNLLESIRLEKAQLEPLKEEADQIIDTSNLNLHQLKSVLFSLLEEADSLRPVRIHVESFGYKYGLPPQADLVIDVRFIPNPFFIPELKPLSGESEPVKRYVLDSTVTRDFLKKFFDLLDYLIPLYEKDGRSNLTIAVGCTGGRHRSVTLAEAIGEHITKTKRTAKVAHRDIDR
ncbi:MAG: RNase adapter RapZ [Deltaproteobacteria bacterium]|nr:RNase adapter RapZ [Deltaproteobacteria bacterium]MBW1954622.1 RNase adapter RapZ [Deltaproteobacteria bacterium]MBW2042287.1 RNase adapter RapZ [Deltaproteobacteria bacterium]MBW2131992.1 RNase adapter RapZ [Deltaproteobacteria bacterium]